MKGSVQVTLFTLSSVPSIILPSTFKIMTFLEVIFVTQCASCVSTHARTLHDTGKQVHSSSVYDRLLGLTNEKERQGGREEGKKGKE